MRVVCAQHAIITDDCRRNRSDAGAIDEAMTRITKEFLACKDAWPVGKGTKFHVKLEIEAEFPEDPLAGKTILATDESGASTILETPNA